MFCLEFLRGTKLLFFKFQVLLVFLFFYPLYKRGVFHKAIEKRRKSIRTTFRRSKARSQSAHTIMSVDNGSRSSRNQSLVSCDIIAVAPKRRLSKNSINKRLLKWLKLSVASIVVDWVSIGVIVVFLFVYTPSSFIKPLMLWLDAGGIISTICVIGYFEDFRTMMFPFLKILRLHENSRNQ